eukprot:TRINITY_DN609_c2_g1_i1.p1 TRINITY_DN609_c2_g1~~TRINITY_DN609_c2_g1_i1.p1  ORF type:complete len:140 (-),score=36.44 TRINITY_DN609_c2_g1_i1:156-548(-)
MEKQPFEVISLDKDDEEVKLLQYIPNQVELFSIGPFLARDCAQQNKEFLYCKEKDKNPENCLEKGKLVTQCSNAIMETQKDNPFLHKYAECVGNHLTHNFYLVRCKDEFEAFENSYEAHKLSKQNQQQEE